MGQLIQYGFDMREATIALLEHQKIDEGVWFIGFDFGLAGGMAGGTPEDVRPTAFLQITKVILVRYSGQGERPPFAVDAAELKSSIAPAKSVRQAKSRRPKE